MKKAVAILGSPRENGNAAKMLALAKQNAEQTGYEITTYNLYERDIAWCKGCMACKKTGICVIHDGIDDIRNDLLTCDLAILSSPCYFANVSAPVKNMFDRLVGAIMDDNYSSIPKPKLSNKQKYLLLATCNTPFPFDRLGSQSTRCIKSMHEFFHISGMKSIGHVIFAGTRGKNEIPQRIMNQINNKMCRA